MPSAKEGRGYADGSIAVARRRGRDFLASRSLPPRLRAFGGAPVEAEIDALRRVRPPSLGVLANHETARRAHTGAFDLAEDHRAAKQSAGVAGGISVLQPANWFGRNPVARQMLSRLRQIFPIEFTKIRSLGQIEFEMFGRDLYEAFQRVHARTCRQRLDQLLLRKALADKLCIANPLHVSNAHQDRLGGLNAKPVDHLLSQPPQHLRLDQDHALVVEPYASVAQGEV